MSFKKFPANTPWRNPLSLLARTGLIFVGAFLVSGCAPEEVTPAAGQADLQQANPVAPAGPSRLVDNRVPGDASFDNYQSATITLDTPRYALHGNNLVLKLRLEQGGVLFVGLIDKHSPFTLQTELPLTATYVEFELVSDSTLDTLVTGRIAL
jgi:hypothetical protein